MRFEHYPPPPTFKFSPYYMFFLKYWFFHFFCLFTFHLIFLLVYYYFSSAFYFSPSVIIFLFFGFFFPSLSYPSLSECFDLENNKKYLFSSGYQMHLALADMWNDLCILTGRCNRKGRMDVAEWKEMYPQSAISMCHHKRAHAKLFKQSTKWLKSDII